MTTANKISIAAMIIPVSGALIWLIFNTGRSFSTIEQTSIDLEKVEGDVSEIKSDVKTLLIKTEGWGLKIDALYQDQLQTSTVPPKLSEFGEKVLAESGIKEIIDTNYDKVFAKVKKTNPSNASQAEASVIAAVKCLKQEKSLTSALNDTAAKSGLDIDTLLFVGAIYARDKILPKLNFKIKDIEGYGAYESTSSDTMSIAQK